MREKVIGIDAPADFRDPEELYGILIKRIRQYHPSEGLEVIEKAYALAKKKHEGQLRKSGEPYIVHPICVAIILADLELDLESIAAGILHDVIEDTDYTEEEMIKAFGSEVRRSLFLLTELPS